MTAAASETAAPAGRFAYAAGNEREHTVTAPPPQGPGTAGCVPELVVVPRYRARRPRLASRPYDALSSARSRAPGAQRELFNAVAAAQNRQRDGRPLLRLVGEVIQPAGFESPEELEAYRVGVSERL